MSYLSTSENVGFSGIPQNISDASCATQYKMAVEGVPGSCSEVNMFIHDSSGDEQTYITHLNDNYFHSKFKIDPNELYTFHDSDVIAGEITVSHTEDNFIFTDNDVKPKLLDSPSKEIDLIGSLTNGEVKEEIKKEVVSNGHYQHFNSVTKYQDVKTKATNIKDSKTSNTKVPKAKTQSQSKEPTHSNSVFEIRRPSVHSPKGQINNATAPSFSNNASIISDNPNSSTSNVKSASTPKLTGSETFLDVFKREQGLVESPPLVIKTEPCLPPPVKTSAPVSGKTPMPAAVKVPPTVAKIPAAVKKTPTAGKSLAVKTATQPKPRRGRGPALHEALQRIPAARRAVAEPNRSWHAPGEELFQCGPLDDKRPLPFTLESSSSDDDNMPDFEAGAGAVCVEESAAESRGARLALRRAALRRHVARAHTTLRLARDYRQHRALASLIKKQLRGQGSSCRVPTETVNQLLAMRGMPAVLTSQERRRLRESGWSGGESGSTQSTTGSSCAEERCTQPPLPCARYCLSHVTLEPEQRLYAACAAVFAGGARCMQPLLPLQDQTPLCAEHAWKRDNYDKISRDSRPKKPAPVRKRVWPPPPRPPRRAKRRRRPPPARPKPASLHSLSEINVCSNSSTYDSSEDTTMGGLSETEYITSAGNSHELEVEVGQVPPDDILDPAVLSQIPDEAFTEFFNQAEGGATFAESSELAAALEAVLDERGLDERALDSIADCLSPQHHHHKNKIQQLPAVSMQSSAPS
ncbi:uncharacterized protein LOC126374787 [Pectinophora gossypiella]|uniref:uncharacterized protein LOC126374787 n=1 Tax=Pectinophora gossypiella TaxID=13191 RepID=UPI00214F0D29|nr:uncharacterized protein LOC126374787 [Pectinophora gossypiella]